MRQRVGDGALKDPLGRCRQRRVGREEIVEPLQRREEALDFAIPLERRRLIPGFGAFGLRQRPVEQVADMREDLPGVRIDESAPYVRSSPAPRTALPPRYATVATVCATAIACRPCASRRLTEAAWFDKPPIVIRASSAAFP